MGAGGVGQTGFSTGGHASGSGAEATGGEGGALAHAASSNAIVPVVIRDNGRARNADEEKSLGWVFLEIGVALVIAGLIVWWTLPRKPRDRKEDDER